MFQSILTSLVGCLGEGMEDKWPLQRAVVFQQTLIVGFVKKGQANLQHVHGGNEGASRSLSTICFSANFDACHLHGNYALMSEYRVLVMTAWIAFYFPNLKNKTKLQKCPGLRARAMESVTELLGNSDQKAIRVSLGTNQDDWKCFFLKPIYDKLVALMKCMSWIRTVSISPRRCQHG